MLDAFWAMTTPRNLSKLDYDALWLKALQRAKDRVERMYPPLGFEAQREDAIERLSWRYFREFTEP